MNIALDLSALDPQFKQHAQRGIGRYVRELKNYFENHSQIKEQVEFFDHMSILGNCGQILNNACDYLPVFKQTFKQQLVLPAFYRNAARKNKIFHFPAHMDAPACFMPEYILTVLDLIPQVLPDLYKAEKNDWRFKLARYLENRAIKNARLLICISECTARDVSRILGIETEKIRVTYLGVDQKFFNLKPAVSREEFFKDKHLAPNRTKLLYVGGIDPRKNWSFALRVIKELHQIDPHNSPYLLFAGNVSSDKQYPALLKMIKDLDLEDCVRLLGYLSEEQLLSAYCHSDAFFFPSLYEGFGLPPLEAMATGLPVLSSDTSCMPEVLGNAALYFNPSNIEQAVQSIQAIGRNQYLRSDLSAKGLKQARKFNWENTGRQTENIYLEILAGR